MSRGGSGRRRSRGRGEGRDRVAMVTKMDGDYGKDKHRSPREITIPPPPARFRKSLLVKSCQVDAAEM